MEEDIKITVPKLGPDIAVDEGPCTLGIYLEVPTHSRRRRSYQLSIGSGEAFDATLPTAPISAPVPYEEYVPDEELFDSPRLFTEMVTLSEVDLQQKMWKEAARWVRFEEDVEEGGQRWSKPRVSTLSLHSFFELRSLLLNGTVALEVEGNNVEEIFTNVLPSIAGRGKLTPEKILQIQETLKCQCVHLFDMIKKKESKAKQLKKNNSIKDKKYKNGAALEEQSPLNGIEEENENFKGNRQFLKKLPEGVEAANILIGEVYYLEKPICIFLRLKEKTNLGSLTEVPVASRFIFLLLGPMEQLQRYSEIGRSFATLLSDEVFREVAYKGKCKSHFLAGMDEFLDASTLLPPGEWDPTIRIEPPQDAPTKESRKKNKPLVEVDEEEEERKLREDAGLTRSGRMFGGLVNDIKRKKPWYISDYKDALSMQSLATFFFLYFACLTPIVTFGGLLGEATGNNIAVMESLVAGLICGVLYGLFSGQPLTILGSTGPVLVFESIVFDFCESQNLNYLSFRMWIGIWAGLILLILVAVDASALVCYITRFTEENFATLIALIFIFKAVQKVLKIGHKYPLRMNGEEDPFCNCTVEYEFEDITTTDFTYEECKNMNGTVLDPNCHKFYPDIFLLSIILFFGTFFISISLKNFKTASFFPTKVRNFISDFAVIIAIVVMTLFDMYLGIATPKLWVPTELKPTSANRGWVVPAFNGNPWWTSLLAFVPALLACILIFMDQQITSVIVNRKEHKLKKGGGYHLDLFLLAILIVVNSVMGLPWFVAATVLSINHVNSLKKESECAAPGEKPQFLGVRENRATHIMIFLFIGLSVFMTPVLSQIPMSVLFGVFMYMGIAALKGIQFFDRILLMFMPIKYQPDHTFLRKVPLKRVHLYTCIQLACLIVLWIIKSFQQTSILFPLMLVIMVGVRKLLDCFFTQRELKILDDALPEFSRMKKMEEEEDAESDDEEKRMGHKRERLMSISLSNGGVIKSPSYTSMNISEEVNKTGLWSTIDNNIKPQTSSNSSSRRGSTVSRLRRRSSILEPIFSNHNYNISYEGEKTLKVPDDTGMFFQLHKRGSKQDSIGPEEVVALTDSCNN